MTKRRKSSCAPAAPAGSARNRRRASVRPELTESGRRPRAGDVEFKTTAGTTVCPLAEAAELALAELLAIRRPGVYRGQRNMPGFYWSSTISRRLSYESVRELWVLMQLDLDPKVVTIATQPFRLHFAAGRNHVPDIAADLTDGTKVIVDVTTALRLEKKPELRRSFEATRRACNDVGWTYRLVRDTDLDPQYIANLQWVASFRRPLHNTGLVEPLKALCRKPISVANVVERCGADPAEVQPVLWHLVARGDLVVEMHRPLTQETIVHERRAA
jgi:hypothetical protein